MTVSLTAAIAAVWERVGSSSSTQEPRAAQESGASLTLRPEETPLRVQHRFAGYPCGFLRT